MKGRGVIIIITTILKPILSGTPSIPVPCPLISLYPYIFIPLSHLHSVSRIPQVPQDATNFACRVGSGGFDLPVLILFLTTLSLLTIISPSRSRKRGFRVDYLTLLACVVIFMVPLLGLEYLHSIDRGISLVVSFSMIALGVHTGRTWATILLCIPSLDEKPLLKQVSPRAPHVSPLLPQVIYVYTW